MTEVISREAISQVSEAEVVRPELVSPWCEWMATMRNMAPSTIKMYSRTLEDFLKSFPDPLEPTVTEDVIEAWVLVKGGSPSTVSNRVSALQCFYRYAKKMKLRLDNPVSDVDRPKRTKSLPKPVENLKRALEELDRWDIKANEKGTQPRRVGETRDMAVFLCYTGLRIHEAVACDWPTPCPTETKIKGKGRKDAIVQIPDKARDAWDRMGGKWPVGARATQRRFERAEFSPHQCRHWRATSLISAGADLGDVKEVMRHENMQTTLGYAAWNTKRTRAAVDLVP